MACSRLLALLCLILQNLISINLKMKQIKTLMGAALMLVMGVLMTSCLDSNDSPTMQSIYVRVVHNMMGGYYFEDAAGNTFIPTTSSVSKVEASGFQASGTNLAYIIFEYIEDEAQQKAGEVTKKQEFKIELLGAQSIDGAGVVIAQGKEDMDARAPETAPVGSLYFDNGWGGAVQPVLYDSNAVLVPISFYLTNDSDKFKLHKLYLACNMEEVTEGDTNLVFYLRHYRGEDENAAFTYSQWYGFDIGEAIRAFAAKAGANPAKLIIKAHESANMTTEIPNEYKDYEIEYKMPGSN